MPATLSSYGKTPSIYQADEFRVEIDDDVLPAPQATVLEDENELENKVQRKQEEILQLKHQQRLVERQKDELEQLSRKQADFVSGRADMHEKLSRLLVTLEREIAEGQRKLEHCLEAREQLAQHYHGIVALRPEEWNRANILEELDRALAIIMDGRTDYERAAARLAPFLDQSRPAAAVPAPTPLLPEDWRFWLKAGAAFTLPLLLLGVLAAALFAIF